MNKVRIKSESIAERIHGARGNYETRVAILDDRLSFYAHMQTTPKFEFISLRVYLMEDYRGSSHIEVGLRQRDAVLRHVYLDSSDKHSKHHIGFGGNQSTCCVAISL